MNGRQPDPQTTQLLRMANRRMRAQFEAIREADEAMTMATNVIDQQREEITQLREQLADAQNMLLRRTGLQQLIDQQHLARLRGRRAANQANARAAA